MTRKQNVRFKRIAIAMALAVPGVSGLHASDLLTRSKSPPAAPRAQTGVSAGTRIIVRYKDGSTAASARALKLSSVRSALQRANVAGNASATAGNGEYVRRLGTGADLFALPDGLSVAQLQQVLAEIRADPQVQYAEIDAMVQPQLVPNDAYYATHQWNFHDPVGGINLPEAWNLSKGAGVVVAVLDTGILPAHPDLAGNVLNGYDFITDAWTSRRATNERVEYALDRGDWVMQDACYAGSPAADSSWHGTHVAGTVVELTDNNIGMAGVAHDAKVLPVRVLGKCGGVASDAIDALVWAAGMDVDGVAPNTNPAEVINMSLGGGEDQEIPSPRCSPAFQDAINRAVARGVTVVVAAGNSAKDVSRSMYSSCENIIVVAATGVTGAIADYSNYGQGVDLAAPGGGGSKDGAVKGFVWQTSFSGRMTPSSGEYVYAKETGTSMAAPHVSGVVALVQSALSAAGRQPLTPAAMEALLKRTARAFPVPPPADTPIGAGILDAKAALQSALQKPCDPSQPSCSSSAKPLKRRKVEKNICNVQGSETFFSVQAEAGKPLSVMTYGGSGDVSAYVAYASQPTLSYYDAHSIRPGNNEVVRIASPKAGTYYIRLFGETDYCNLSLTVLQ